MVSANTAALIAPRRRRKEAGRSARHEAMDAAPTAIESTILSRKHAKPWSRTTRSGQQARAISCLFFRHASNSDEKALLFEAVVQVGDEVAVTVPFESRAPLVGAEHPLGRLAPARMRHVGIDVRPEAVLAPLHGFPERYGPLFDEREANDRFDRLEPIFPRQRQTQRRPVLLGDRLAVHPGHQKGEL